MNTNFLLIMVQDHHLHFDSFNILFNTFYVNLWCLNMPPLPFTPFSH